MLLLHIDEIHAGKVSTIFDLFFAGFAKLPELGLNRVELGAELNYASSGATFEGGCPSENITLPQNTDFFQIFGQSIWRRDSLF